MDPMKSYKIPMECLFPCKFWRKFRPPLIQRKFIGILEDFIPIGIFPTKPFELKEWTLWNPIKLLRNASSHTSFGGILTRGRTSWKKLEKILWVFISPQIPVFFLWSNQTVIPMFFLCFAILCFTLTFLSESYVFPISPFSHFCDS